MGKPILGVDVDDTVVPSVKHWVNWYFELTGHELTYDLRTNGKTNDILDLMHKHSSPTDFWKQSDLYQKMEPRTGSVEVLEELSKYYDIIFISASMPEHTHSKEMFLTKYFGFHKGFISTSTKEYVYMDVFIDDYKKYLRNVKSHQPDCDCIQIKTKLSNEGEFPLLNWWEIRDRLLDKVSEGKE